MSTRNTIYYRKGVNGSLIHLYREMHDLPYHLPHLEIAPFGDGNNAELNIPLAEGYLEALLDALKPGD